MAKGSGFRQCNQELDDAAPAFLEASAHALERVHIPGRLFAPEGVAQPLFGEARGRARIARQRVTQFNGIAVWRFGHSVEGKSSTRVDRDAHVDGSVCADAVVVFEGEAERIENGVATGRARIHAMRFEALSRAESGLGF